MQCLGIRVATVQRLSKDTEATNGPPKRAAFRAAQPSLALVIPWVLSALAMT